MSAWNARRRPLRAVVFTIPGRPRLCRTTSTPEKLATPVQWSGTVDCETDKECTLIPADSTDQTAAIMRPTNDPRHEFFASVTNCCRTCYVYARRLLLQENPQSGQ